MRGEKTADQETHAEEISGNTVEAQDFDVTLVTPCGARVSRARANEHVWDEAKAARLNLSAPYA